mmetsp:Transcript_24373/g.40403  ORF Transcript_24373/g.40403 Transcript_24373/m.40403 type:complete len:297 (+) Transcript_24373:78-968(+)|eukprot:CAMPEP_0119030730 /NCGR_PEP_ID=MMETSP1176-20130426/41178_1 /TAXON_ID=265551 /ORGANISM="Synedropsis recta cf, Strain CCMP1620" /LENGTH=296 /DNA_ID=CAMNT_0006987105 /DNA_START=54 /DNA_END=944 /DNA_ORIENTATION=+
MSNPPTIYFKAYSERNIGNFDPKNKKEVTFRFVLVDDQQQQKDYKVVIKWSFTSGKQSVCINERESYHFKVPGTTAFDQEVKTEDDGLYLHLLGVKKTPNGGHYNYSRHFDLLINDTVLFSSCPHLERGGKRQQENKHASVLRLLYPNHALCNEGTQQQHGAAPAHTYAPATYTQPAHAYAPAKLVVAAPDLLLMDFDPIPTPAVLAAPVATSTMFNPMAAPPAAAPPAPPATNDPFGVQPPPAAPYSNYITDTTAAPAVNPFDAPQQQMHQFGGIMQAAPPVGGQQATGDVWSSF